MSAGLSEADERTAPRKTAVIATVSKSDLVGSTCSALVSGSCVSDTYNCRFLFCFFFPHSEMFSFKISLKTYVCLNFFQQELSLSLEERKGKAQKTC